MKFSIPSDAETLNSQGSGCRDRKSAERIEKEGPKKK